MRANALIGMLLLCAGGSAGAGVGVAEPNAETVKWFQTTEQSLMDAVASGDKAVWERVLDDAFVMTSEEGEVLPREQLLKDMRPLPAGLSGKISVKELTVQEFPTFAVVRYLADETEQVFAQSLATKYRMTDTFRRDGKAWKMIASHASVVTADPPAQPVPAARFAGLVGEYKLLPDGWTFTVELRDGKLYGGRDAKKMKPMVPITATAFVVSGSLGEWLFDVDDKGKAQRIVDLRKFETLIWTRTR